jgi:hypothetical protein
MSFGTTIIKQSVSHVSQVDAHYGKRISASNFGFLRNKNIVSLLRGSA